MECDKKISVLFVCLGNICRSPTAEAIFRAFVKRDNLDNSIIIDSAGTANYHTGGTPDSRAMTFALKRNYDLSSLRARQLVIEDFSKYDYILAMDKENLHNILSLQPEQKKTTIDLMLNFSSGVKNNDVPDPYYGGDDGFDNVLDLLEDACQGLLDVIKSKHFE